MPKRFFLMTFLLLSWVSGAHAAMPLEMLARSMCEGDDFTFRSCYSATKEQCNTWALEGAKECMAKVPEPNVKGLPPSEAASAFGNWGVKMGHCTEQSFHEKHKSTFSKDEKCQGNLKLRQAGYAKD